MAGTDDRPTEYASGGGPDWTRVLVVALCLASVLLAAMLVPSLGGMDSLGPDAGEGAADDAPAGGEDSTTDDSGSELAQAAEPDLEFDPAEGLGDFDAGGSDGGEAGAEGGEAGSGDGEASSENGGDAPSGDGDAPSAGDLETPSAVGSNGLEESHQVGGPISEERYQEAGSAVVFVADVDRPVYWRQGSYDRYTGSGWERTEDYEPFTELDGPDGSEQVIRQDVEFRTSVQNLPGGWQIADVDAEGEASFERDSDGSVRAAEPLAPGTSVSIESHQSTADADRLRAAGTAYDPAIREQYGTYPQTASAKVAAFTDDLTADDDTPYDQARTIQSWIRQSKTYDLGATHDPDEPMVEQFVFDMEGVYCSYAASAMTVMLRSQDVPARYVVGYSPGVAVDGVQVVTQQNAHAWVEVYFPGEGWIRFDPTPQGDRQSAMQDELEGETGDLQSAAAGFGDSAGDADGDDSGDRAGDDGDGESGGDGTAGDSDGGGSDGGSEAGESEGGSEDSESEGGESGDAGDDATDDSDAGSDERSDEEDADDESGDGPPGPPYEITTEDPLVPGTEIEVAVTKDGVPVPDVTVAFEGESVGETDESGRVTGSVPYVAEVTISVVSPDDATVDEATATDATVEDGIDGLGVGVSPSGVAGAGRLAGPLATAQQSENASLSTFATEGGLEIRADDAALPGDSLELQVHVAEHPVANASVRLDGEHVAITDENGTATVGLPSEPGSYEVAVERGELSADRSVAVRPLDVSVDALMPLPGGDVTVAVDHAGTPVTDAVVAVDGERVATETPNGTATVSLPVAPAADVRVRHGAGTAETTVSGLYRNAVLLAVAVVGLVGGGAALAIRRSGVGRSDLRRALARLASLARTAGGRALEVFSWLVRRPVEVAVTLGRVLATAARRLGAWCRVLPRRLERWLRETASLVVTRGFGALALLDPRRLFGWLVALVRGAGSRAAGSSDGSAGRGFDATDSTGTEPSEQQVTLRTLWKEFLDVLRPSRRRTRTPGEIERYALSRGLPREPVQTIVQTFREAEYGRRQPSGERVDRVRTAVTAVQSGPEAATASDTADSSQTEPADADDDPTDDSADGADAPGSGGDG